MLRLTNDRIKYDLEYVKKQIQDINHYSPENFKVIQNKKLSQYYQLT